MNGFFFNDGVNLFSTNKDVKEFNHYNLNELSRLVANIPAHHRFSKAKSVSAEILDGLPSFILLSIRSIVMILSNILVENGLVSGA